MALKEAQIDCPLAVGVDTDTDRKQVPIGKLLALQNGELTSPGEVRKRNGYTKLGADLLQADQPVDEGYGIHSNRGALLIEGRNDVAAGTDINVGPGVFAYSADVAEWVHAGRRVPVEPSVLPASDSSPTHQTGSVCAAGGFRVYAYKGPSGLHIDIIDPDGVKIHEDRSGGPVYGQVQAVAVGTSPRYAVILWRASTNTVYRLVWDSQSPEAMPAPYALFTDIHADGAMSVAVAGWDDTILLAYKSTTPNRIKLQRLSVAGGALTTTYIDDAGIGAQLSIGVIPLEAASRTLVVYKSGLRIWNAVLDASGVVLVSPQQVSTDDVTEDALRITGADDAKCNTDTGTSCARVFVEYDEVAASPDYSRRLGIFLFGSDGTIPAGTAYEEFYRYNIGLAGAAFAHNSTAHVLGTFQSDTQAAFFLLSVWNSQSDKTTAPELLVDCKALSGRGAGLRAGNNVSNVHPLGSGKFLYAVRTVSFLWTSSSKEYAIRGLQFDMDPGPAPSVEIDGETLLGGGVVSSYDGGVQESNFHVYPEPPIETGQDATGNLTTGGTYGFKAVCRYVDRFGRIIRSGASDPLVVTLTASNIDVHVKFQIPMLSDRFGKPAVEHILLDIYRTINGGSTYYWADIAEVFWWEGSTYVDYVGGWNADSFLLDKKVLYTTGGILSNGAPPPSHRMTLWNGRVCQIPDDDRTVWWYSKAKAQNRPVEFSPFFVTASKTKGDYTAIGSMYDKLILFKEDGVLYVTGQGPNDAGLGSFAPERVIASDVGCVDRNSLVSTDAGLFFKSKKGICLLQRDLTVVPIGDAVSAYDSYTVLAANLMADKTQVRFTLSDGQPTLVYNYQRRQWGVFTNHSDVHAAVVDGVFTRVQSDGTVLQEDSSYTDDATSIALLLETPWLKAGGLHGLQRLWWLQILGEWKTAHTLQVSIWYDGEDSGAASEVFTFDCSSDPGEYIARMKPALQKCRSFKLRIEDTSPSGTEESCRLSGLRMLAGVRPGFKLPSTKTL